MHGAIARRLLAAIQEPSGCRGDKIGVGNCTHCDITLCEADLSSLVI